MGKIKLKSQCNPIDKKLAFAFHKRRRFFGLNLFWIEFVKNKFIKESIK
jgi:hypothetical protein